MIFDSGEQRAFPGRFDRRRLVFALSLSLFAHLLLLAGDVARPPQPAVTSGLTASLQPRAILPSAPPPMLETPPAQLARPAPPVHSSRRRAVASRDKSSDQPVAASRTVLSAPTFSLPAEPMSRQAPAPLPADSATPPAVATSVATANAVGMTGPQPEAQRETPPETHQETGISADGLRRYRLSLAVQARRFKRYPPQALAAGWSGTANIRLTVDASAQSEASVARSSGYAVLDEAARTMIAQSAQRTPLPEELRGKAFSLELPVLFNIADEVAGSARAEPAE